LVYVLNVYVCVRGRAYMSIYIYIYIYIMCGGVCVRACVRKAVCCRLGINTLSYVRNLCEN